MVAELSLEKIREVAISCLVEELDGKLLGLAIFGSVARGEADERSDLDFFVLTRGLEGSREEMKRRVYSILAPVNRRFKRDVSVLALEEGEITDITPLLINIAHDAVILF